MYNLSKLMKYGEDVYVADNVVIKHPEKVTLGSHVAIDDYFYLTTQFIMGDYCHISSHVSVVGGIRARLRMGNFSHLAAGAKVIVYGDENLGEGLVSPVIPDRYRDRMVGGRVVIGDFASVLTNAIIAPGVWLGEGSVLAAGGFARVNIPPWEVWGGTPARFLKFRERGKMIELAGELGYG
jgi:acetyltransferase-like isoleucine patch superfamily enzyme